MIDRVMVKKHIKVRIIYIFLVYCIILKTDGLITIFVFQENNTKWFITKWEEYDVGR